jgi:riboflavin kinase/FMN adenylyltransferase
MQVPTLNLAPENELTPRIGVYVSRISLDGGAFMNSVTNVGFRPTFNGTERTIETFVLGPRLPDNAVTARLEFLYRLRSEQKFNSAEALRRQISVDVERAKRFFRVLGLDG